MATPFEEPAIPSRTEEDTLEQQLPAVPEPEEDGGADDPVRPHGDPLLPGGPKRTAWTRSVMAPPPTERTTTPGTRGRSSRATGSSRHRSGLSGASRP